MRNGIQFSSSGTAGEVGRGRRKMWLFGSVIKGRQRTRSCPLELELVAIHGSIHNVAPDISRPPRPRRVPACQRGECDRNIFDSRERGLRKRTKAMEDISYFSVGGLEGTLGM